MISASYRLDSFRPWNPFHDKPEALDMSSANCRYPSPFSITATPTSLSDDVPNMHTYVDKAQRHPLPARPPKEVCLNTEAQSPSQSILPEFSTPQQTVQETHRSSTPEIQVPTADIDPAILDNDFLSSARPSGEASSCQEDTDCVSISETSSVLPSTFDNILSAENPGQHSRRGLATTHRQTAAIAKGYYARQKPTKSGSSRRPLPGTTPHNSPTFFSIRSQFFAMSLQDRLQFVS